jgi:cytochrome c nitrite reductase small subunit
LDPGILRKYRLIIGAAAIMLIAGAAALPGYMKKTATPDYCSSCHVMADQYEDWFYTGRHKQVACVECHLPNDNFARHYFWKGYDGMKDVFFFYSGLVADPVHSSSHARRTVQANCLRCHEEMVSRISTEGVQCWDCHRKLFHQKTNEF